MPDLCSFAHVNGSFFPPQNMRDEVCIKYIGTHELIQNMQNSNFKIILSHFYVFIDTF